MGPTASTDAPTGQPKRPSSSLAAVSSLIFHRLTLFAVDQRPVTASWHKLTSQSSVSFSHFAKTLHEKTCDVTFTKQCPGEVGEGSSPSHFPSGRIKKAIKQCNATIAEAVEEQARSHAVSITDYDQISSLCSVTVAFLFIQSCKL